MLLFMEFVMLVFNMSLVLFILMIMRMLYFCSVGFYVGQLFIIASPQCPLLVVVDMAGSTLQSRMA